MAEKKEKKPVSKIISYVIDGIMGVLIAFLLFVMVSMITSSHTSPYGVPSVFGRSFLYVATDSMDIDKGVNEEACNAKSGDAKDLCLQQIIAEDVSEFDIKHFAAGDGVIIVSVNPSEVKVGDVISFYYDPLGALDTHRVKAIVEPGETIQYVPIGDETHPISIENKTSERKFITRGDNLHASLSASSSGWAISYYEEVSANVLVGKVIHASSGLGFFLSLVSPSVPGGYAMIMYPLFVLVPLLVIGILSIIDIAKEVRKQKKEEEAALAAALAEAGIDPEDERAVYIFATKWAVKQEMKEAQKKEKERIKKAMRKEMEKELRKQRAMDPSEREAMKAALKEEMRKEREAENASSELPELSEREKLKAELKEQMRKEREAAKKAEQENLEQNRKEGEDHD